MALTFNVPDIEINENGITAPETQDILAGVLLDLLDVFGERLNIANAGTPQGFLAAEYADAIVKKNAALIDLMQQFDPSTATGRWLDAIAQIYFIERRKATATVVTALCTGIPYYTLPAGSLAIDDAGNVYESLGSATFGAGGTVNVPFQCQVLGAIECPAGTLNKIGSAVAGWDAVTNETAGVIGNDLESDRAFEQRRYDSVAKNAQGSIFAVKGAIMSLDGVTDCYVTENPTNEIKTAGATNYQLKPHSVYVAVIGGGDLEIAETIWMNKNAGSDMNGNTTVSVEDKSSYVRPFPTYQITFNRPTPTPVYFTVNIADSPDLPAEIIPQTQAAVTDVFSGESGSGRAIIGGTVYASSYYAAVSALSDYVNVISIFVGKTQNPASTACTFGIDESPVIGGITVNITEV